MRRKFYEGYRQGSWTIIEAPHKSKKALMKCDCGFETWNWLSNLSSHNSQKCKNCLIQSPEHKTYLMVLRTASRRSLSWEINESQWIDISSQNCYYCGIEPSNIIADYGYRYSGLDRIDSSKGYSLENVVPCCRTCNLAKSDMSQKEFFEWVKRIYGQVVSKF